MVGSRSCVPGPHFFNRLPIGTTAVPRTSFLPKTSCSVAPSIFRRFIIASGPDGLPDRQFRVGVRYPRACEHGECHGSGLRDDGSIFDQASDLFIPLTCLGVVLSHGVKHAEEERRIDVALGSGLLEPLMRLGKCSTPILYR